MRASFFLLLTVFRYASGCILLLNGWHPVSVYERTYRADIVVRATVVRAYKRETTPSGTYSADLRVRTVFKGERTLRRLAPRGNSSSLVYAAGNFGRKTMCYADVEEGHTYIFFLTVFNGRLSGKYDDIFGAATEYTAGKELEVTASLGWKLWSTWSPCSASCGAGFESRTRTCLKEKCEGVQTDERTCNEFRCSEVRDLLTLLGVRKLPANVGVSKDRPSAYDIKKGAKLFAPVPTIFHGGMPKDFSVIITARFAKDSRGLVLTLTDVRGRQKVAIHYGSNPKFEYYDQNEAPGRRSPSFNVNMADDRWHQFAYSARDQLLTLYFDCTYKITQPFTRSKMPVIGANIMVAIGSYYARYGDTFEGEVEQLLVGSDPDLAARQCYKQSMRRTDQAVMDENPVKEKSSTKSATKATVKDLVVSSSPARESLLLWSTWSSCSVTCGEGKQTRTLYCVDNTLDVDGCGGEKKANDESRVCVKGDCPESCEKTCLHGGVCSSNRTLCVCKDGYYGDRCEHARCHTSCHNRGRCVAPDRCRCLPGYGGKFCTKVTCSPPCKNGGRCIRPGVCACSAGYFPPDCRPFCMVHCKNGGDCVGPNTCKCRVGYSGSDCSRPICNRSCFHGGTCVARDRCSCPSGFTGEQCETAHCYTPCRNGGSCIYPAVCRCPHGTHGTLCEKFTCRPQCQNKGRCVGPNQCACKPKHAGRFCHLKRCRLRCLNGGRCQGGNCICSKGHHGKMCEKRKCIYEKYTEPYTRTYKKSVTEERTTKCGPWLWRTCKKSRLKYVTVTKTFPVTAYRCV